MSQEYATRDFNETDVPNLTSAFYHAARDESDEGLDDYSDKEHCRATKKAVRAEQDLSPECLDERLEGSHLMLWKLTRIPWKVIDRI